MYKVQKYFHLTVAYLCFFIASYSQATSKTVTPIKFRSSLNAGLLCGQSGSKPAFTASTINGIEINKWFAGIGVGIDYYGEKRSVPLFAAVQKELSKKVNSFFLYGDAGHNFAWLKDNQKMTGVLNYKKMGGLFYEAGAGYKFKIAATGQFGLSAGYSFKQMEERYNYPCYWCEYAVPPSEIYKYNYRRIVIKFNWWFL